MKTSPSFQFYPADFLMGTMLMSADETGAYIRLLCWQWQQGSVPGDLSQSARIGGIPARRMAAVLAKFEEGEDGQLRNARMESVRAKLEAYREKASELGKKGGRPRKEGGGEADGKGSERVPLLNPLDNQKGKESSQSQSQSQTTLEPSDNPRGREDSWPSLDEVKAFAETILTSEACAVKWWREQESVSWRYKNQPITKWKPLFSAYATTWKANEAAGKRGKAPQDNGITGLKMGWGRKHQPPGGNDIPTEGKEDDGKPF